MSSEIDEVIQAANAIEEDCKRSQFIYHIAASLAQSNKPDEPQKLFDEAIRILNTIEDGDNKSDALSKIIVEKLEIKDVNSRLIFGSFIPFISGNVYGTSVSS